MLTSLLREQWPLCRRHNPRSRGRDEWGIDWTLPGVDGGAGEIDSVAVCIDALEMEQVVMVGTDSERGIAWTLPRVGGGASG